MKSYAIQISKLSTKNTLILDLKDNFRPDLILQWRDKTLIHHFFDNQNQKINISVKNVGKTLVKEFSKLVSNQWELTRREKHVHFSNGTIKKEVERFNQKGKSLGKKIYIVEENQASQVTITPANIENLVLHDGDESLSIKELQNLSGANGDCRTLAIVKQGFEIYLENILEKSYTTLDFKKFFNIQGCLKACDESKLDCLTQKDKRKYCAQDLGSVFMNSIKNNLRCLNDLNPALGAQLAGLIFYNKLAAPNPDKCVYGSDSDDDVSGCKKINIKCKDEKDMDEAWGSATLNCHPKWPSINLSRMMCHEKKFIGPVSMSQTFLHESIHLLGYAHGEDPEMAYACTLACGNINESEGVKLNLVDNKVKKHKYYQKGVQGAENICRNGLNVDGLYREQISYAMLAYGKTALYDKYQSFQFNPEIYGDVDLLFQRALFDKRRFEEIQMPLCQRVLIPGDKYECKDNGGYIRDAWYSKKVLGQSSTSLINIFMFGDRDGEVFKDLEKTLSSELFPSWYQSTNKEKYGDNYNLLKTGSFSLAKRLQYIGEDFKRYDYHNVVEKMTRLYKEIKDRPTERLFTSKGKNKGFDKQVLSGIKKLMIDFCIRNEDELNFLPARTKASDLTAAIEKCEAFKFGEP
jgi:hypothetical protein